MSEQLDKIHAQLQDIRRRTDLEVRPCKYLVEEFPSRDGTMCPLKLRYYQVQGVLHLLTMKRFILGDDTGTGKCVTGDTLVKTGRGLVPIRDLNPGITTPDTFLPLEGETVSLEGETLPIRQFYYGGVKATHKIRTSQGYEIEGSTIHPVRIFREGQERWVKLPDVKEGDYLCIDRSPYSFNPETPLLPQTPRQGGEKVYPVPERMTPDLARFLGYLVAEGWFNNRYHFFLSQKEETNPRICEDIEGLIAGLFQYPLRKKGNEYSFSSSYLIRWLSLIGVGKGVSQDKVVPWSILQGDRESVRNFLMAYLDAEGHVKNGLEVSSASETLLKQVQILLLGFGVISRRAVKIVKGREGVYWKLVISGEDLRTFSEFVGLISERKKEALIPLIQRPTNPNLDVVPGFKGAVENLRREIYDRCGLHGYKGEGIAKRFGVSFYTTLGHIRSGRRNPTYAYLHKMLDVAREVGVPISHPSFERIQSICQGNRFYDPVVLKEEGRAEVFDIEVGDPRHCFVGNGVVNHNTLQSIAALCFMWERHPETKAIVLTTKSAVGQWCGEFQKFTQGVRVIRMGDLTPKRRKEVYQKFQESKGPTVLVMNYAKARTDFQTIQNWSGYVLVADECTAFKSTKSQIHKVCRHLAKPDKAARVWGLSATIIKNNLYEGYGIYKVIAPWLFNTQQDFYDDYCVIELLRVKGQARRIPRIKGHRPHHIRAFREKIDLYFLGRPKHEVATELPTLITRQVSVGLSNAQKELYSEALSGLLMVGEGEDAEHKEVTPLTAVTYCQQVVNHPSLIGREGKSEKLDELVEMLSEGDLSDEKVIIFSRLEKMITIIADTLNAKRKTKEDPYCVRVTGKEKGPERELAQNLFQSPTSETRVICITTAGSDAINLQAAKAIIFFDIPLSAGDYIQAVGRMVRIGSIHDSVYAIHMVVPGSIDEKSVDRLVSKMHVIEGALGRKIKGSTQEEDDDFFIPVEDGVNELFNSLKEDARRIAAEK